LTLAVMAAFVGGYSIAAHAQAPVAVTRGGTVGGSGSSRTGGEGEEGRQPATTPGPAALPQEWGLAVSWARPELGPADLKITQPGEVQRVA